MFIWGAFRESPSLMVPSFLGVSLPYASMLSASMFCLFLQFCFIYVMLYGTHCNGHIMGTPKLTPNNMWQLPESYALHISAIILIVPIRPICPIRLICPIGPIRSVPLIPLKLPISFCQCCIIRDFSISLQRKVERLCAN